MEIEFNKLGFPTWKLSSKGKCSHILSYSDGQIGSHFEFFLKNPNLLWKNLKFFIYLPFKKNEDVNPTKASHRGMNPEHLALATQELSTLLSEGLIEVDIFIFLEWKVYEKFWVFPQRIWIFKEEFRMAVSTTTWHGILHLLRTKGYHPYRLMHWLKVAGTTLPLLSGIEMGHF